MRKITVAILLVCLSALFFGGCISGPPRPDEVVVPTPRYDNHGKYMCCYTQDDVLAEWIDKAICAKLGATVGEYAGREVGKKILEQVPIIGGWLGEKAGQAAGRAIAIEMAGGWDYIKSTSDTSFDSIGDYAVYLYAKYSHRENYQEVLEAVWEIYPELKKRYAGAINNAKRR